MLRNFSEQEIKTLRKNFIGARPFQNVLVENVLQNSKSLLAAIKKEKFFKKDSDLFSFSQTNNLFFSKNKIVAEAVSLFSSSKFSSLVSNITGQKLKQGAVDVSAALYAKNNYLLCHDDQVEDRKIAFILYLSESLSEKDGGALSFFYEKAGHPQKRAIANYPIQNSMMLFSVSAKSWHEVEEMLTDKKRCTIGGWMH